MGLHPSIHLHLPTSLRQWTRMIWSKSITSSGNSLWSGIFTYNHSVIYNHSMRRWINFPFWWPWEINLLWSSQIVHLYYHSFLICACTLFLSPDRFVLHWPRDLRKTHWGQCRAFFSLEKTFCRTSLWLVEMIAESLCPLSSLVLKQTGPELKLDIIF